MTHDSLPGLDCTLTMGIALLNPSYGAMSQPYDPSSFSNRQGVKSDRNTLIGASYLSGVAK